MPTVQQYKKIGSDYFTRNFYVKESKTKMSNIHALIFICLFKGQGWGFELKLGFELYLSENQ